MANKAPKIMYVYVSVGTQCNPATSSSTPVDDAFDPAADLQETEIDGYLDEGDSFEDEKWKCASFYSMSLKNIILPMMGSLIYLILFNGWSTHYPHK